MKKILLSIFMVLLVGILSGCADKRIILVPQTEYYPTFDTSDFNVSRKQDLEMWVETEDVNGTTKTYLVAEKTPMLIFIKDTKELRSQYNVLLRKINDFNEKIKEQNEIQNNKKPQEIESIKDSFYK